MYISSHLTILLTLAQYSITSALPPLRARDTAELYIFANCISTKTHASYAAIFWYYPDFLPDYPEPQLTAYINNHTSIQYAGKTTKVTHPFTLTAAIPRNATAAKPGTLVSTNASAGSFAGLMAVFRGSGEVFYRPEKRVACLEEYYMQDVG